MADFRKSLSELTSEIEKRLPGVSVKIDAPLHPPGHWFIDLWSDKKHLVIEYRSALPEPFGIYTSPISVYGEGPDELYADPESVVSRAVLLLSQD